MANGPAFDQAVPLAAAAPDLSVGCHVELVDGSSLLPPSQVPTLTQGRDRIRFYRSSSAFAWHTISGRVSPAQIELEAVAQIRKLQAAGISVTHLDTHKHTHIVPRVLQSLVRAAQACGVRKIRNPFEPLRISGLIRRPGLWKRWIQFRTLSAMARAFRETAKNAGMITTDGTIGMVATGALDEKLFRALIENLPDGTWEFVCHPGYNDPELQSLQTRLRKSREQELEILIASPTRDLLQRNHIELISYQDLT